MFKKKTTIPPRPKPPKFSHILSDLDNSAEDDIVFRRNKNLFDVCPESANADELNPGKTVDDNDPDTLYSRVKKFVEINSCLQQKMLELQERHETLQISDIELKTLAEKIRKQALNALK